MRLARRPQIGTCQSCAQMLFAPRPANLSTAIPTTQDGRSLRGFQRRWRHRAAIALPTKNAYVNFNCMCVSQKEALSATISKDDNSSAREMHDLQQGGIKMVSSRGQILFKGLVRDSGLSRWLGVCGLRLGWGSGVYFVAQWYLLHHTPS